MLFPLIRSERLGKFRALMPYYGARHYYRNYRELLQPRWNIPNMLAGSLEVRLAESEKEIKWAKELRYQVFVKEMGARPSRKILKFRQDSDEFDEYCDHLLVIDRSVKRKNPVVGTYRLLRRSRASEIGRFYSESEFDISPILKIRGEILELGRSCVHKNYRDRATMQLLWRGIGAYVTHYDIKLLFGCASFPGADPEIHAEHLSYLYNSRLAPEEFRARAAPGRYIKMDSVSPELLDPNRLAATLPPLIKGYIRLGGMVGNGAVVDYAYNTTDICIILKIDLITEKYANRYTPSRNRNAE